MIILIGGSSHVGKTLISQKRMRKKYSLNQFQLGIHIVQLYQKTKNFILGEMVPLEKLDYLEINIIKIMKLFSVNFMIV